jgi:hypothetical protein
MVRSAGMEPLGRGGAHLWVLVVLEHVGEDVDGGRVAEGGVGLDHILEELGQEATDGGVLVHLPGGKGVTAGSPRGQPALPAHLELRDDDGDHLVQQRRVSVQAQFLHLQEAYRWHCRFSQDGEVFGASHKECQAWNEDPSTPEAARTRHTRGLITPRTGWTNSTWGSPRQDELSAPDGGVALSPSCPPSGRRLSGPEPDPGGSRPYLPPPLKQRGRRLLRGDSHPQPRLLGT